MTTPIIFDTDIGSDIDDTWALAFALRCPELDVKLVTTDRGRPEYRARLACQVLEAGGRADIPVGLGPEWEGNTGQRRQEPCAEGYGLSGYDGEIAADGVQAMIDVIQSSPEPVTVVAIGPLPTVRAALEREPAIARAARFVGMHGSLRTQVAEANVKNDPQSCRAAFEAGWPVTITPLDTCGLVQLTGQRHQRLVASAAPLARCVMENYRVWWQNSRGGQDDPDRWQHQSSILYDTVAVHLAHTEDFLHMEDLGVRVDDEGFTRLDESAPAIRCATEWRDLDAFYDMLADRLAEQG